MDREQHPNPGHSNAQPHIHNPYLQRSYYPTPLPAQHYAPPPGVPNYAFPPGLHYAPPLPPGTPVTPQYAPPTNAQPQQYLQAPFMQAPFTQAPFTQAPFTQAPFTQAPFTQVPSTVPTQQCPNNEPRPGIFTFQVDVLGSDGKSEFSAETDISWEYFQGRVLAYLENVTGKVELSCKVTGDSGRASRLKNEDDFKAAMARLCQKACNARSRAVGLEIRNTAKALTVHKSNKRGRENDIPPVLSEEQSTQIRTYNQLEATIRCETHRGHCFVDRTNGVDTHRRLSHAEMTLWAKKISPGEATIYNPPHCLNFDCGPTKKLRRMPSSSTVPEVHVTVQNITSDANLAGSHGVSSPASRVISGSSSISHGPTIALSAFTAPSFPDNKTLPHSPSPCPSPSPNPFEAKLFPPVSKVIALVEVDKPGEDFGKLENILLEAGIVTSEQLLLLPEDVLCVIGYMGQVRARILCNYARRIVLPLLGLRGNYEEPEIVADPRHFDSNPSRLVNAGTTRMGAETQQWPSECSRAQDSPPPLQTPTYRRKSDSSSAVSSTSASFLSSTHDGVSPSNPSPVLLLTPHTSAHLPREPPSPQHDLDQEHESGCQETRAESIGDIIDILESGSDDGNGKNTTSNEDDAWD